MTRPEKHPANPTPAAKAADDKAPQRQRREGELHDQDLDQISGGPTAVERNHNPI
jgi:hypothetical protein